MSDDLRELAQADILLLIAEWIREPAPEPVTPQHAGELARFAGLEPHSALTRAAAAMAACEGDALMREQARLFHGPILCPPNETAYVRRDKGAILGDITGFYRAFGFALRPATAEKADHLGAELEFLAMLLVMLHRARVEVNEEHETVTRNAIGSFARDHLGEWLLGFAGALRSSTGLDAYRELADLIEAVWTRIAGEYPAAIEERPAPYLDPGTPYECGLAGSCPGPAPAAEAQP